MRRSTFLGLRNNSANSWDGLINGYFNGFAMNSMHGVEAIYSSIRRILVLSLRLQFVNRTEVVINRSYLMIQPNRSLITMTYSKGELLQ